MQGLQAAQALAAQQQRLALLLLGRGRLDLRQVVLQERQVALAGDLQLGQALELGFVRANLAV